jgi:hypothetical protein
VNQSTPDLKAQFVKQFDEPDRPTAQALVDAILEVPLEDVESELIRLASAVLEQREVRNKKERGKRKAVMALYVERELEGGTTKAPLFFPATKRAIEPDHVPLIRPTRGGIAVGSEGSLARLASNLQATNPRQIVLSPGPDRIRRRKVRNIVILTDVIASGTRIERMLSAFYAVGSVRSWLSAKWIKFHVVAFAATSTGEARLRRHATRPQLHVHRALPTITSEFGIKVGKGIREEVEDLCRRYDPDPTAADIGPLGYGGIGALIAIGRRCPNNAPRLLYASSKHWTPLFPKFLAEGPLGQRIEELDRMVRLLDTMREPRLGERDRLTQVWAEARPLILILASLARGERRDHHLAATAGVPFRDAERLLRDATACAWIDHRRRLTEEGKALLQTLRKLRPVRKALPEQASTLYFPPVLREPVPLPS